MEVLPAYPVLKFHSDTLQTLRKLYNLDAPGRMNEAIDILEEWLKKQYHFKKKDFSRSYLERIIIAAKGSLERAKSRLDKNCTFRTLMPQFFDICDFKNDFKEVNDLTATVPLPTLTKDNYRICLLKIYDKPFESSHLTIYYKFSILLWEYLRAHDYGKGFFIIIDYRELNLLDFLTKINPIELKDFLTLGLEGYGMRVQGIHVISTSKVIDTVVAIFKQALSAKVGGRIRVHKTVDTLFEYMPQELLPSDYGGGEKSLRELQNDWLEVLGSKEHIEYMKEMNQACTDETLRQTGKFNEEYIGMPGSFRSLSVD